ncbi:MAG: ABC transporter ATP-binding protein, partial [Gemmobacter sp.]|nr:ABC transporter ATP-binding protein [Gemmobacter sp.]
MKISAWIEPFRPADGPPPRTLAAFFAWGLSGSWPAMLLATVLSVVAGVLEVLTALMLGKVIDVTTDAGPDGFFVTNAGLLTLFAIFFIVIR